MLFHYYTFLSWQRCKLVRGNFAISDSKVHLFFSSLNVNVREYLHQHHAELLFSYQERESTDLRAAKLEMN